MEKKTLYISWLVSYFVFVALFLAVVLVLTMSSRSVLKTEIMNANLSTFRTVTSNIASLKTNLTKMVTRASSEQNLSELLRRNSFETPEDYLALYQMTLELNRVVSIYDDVDRVGLYFVEPEVYLEGGAILDGMTAYERSAMDFPVGRPQQYDEWKQFITQGHVQQLYRTARGETAYIQSLPMGRGKRCAANMVVYLKDAAIRGLAGEYFMEPDRLFFLVDDAGNMLYQSQNHPLADEYVTGGFALPDQTQTFEIEGRKMIVTAEEAEPDLICVYAVDSSVFWHKLNLWVTLLGAVIILLAVVGIILSVLFAKKYYHPVEKIVNSLARLNPKEPEAGNEFEYIEKNLRLLMEDAHDHETMKQKYRSMSLNSALAGYLKASGPALPLRKILKRYGITMPMSQYFAALISINDISDYFGTIDFENEQQEQELLELAVTNVFTELLGNDFKSITIRLDSGMLLAFIGTNRDGQNEQAVKEAFEQAQAFEKEELGIYFSVYISRPFQEPESLRDAYQETLDMNAVTDFSQEVVSYGDVNWTRQRYEFSVETERSLIALIHAGDETGAAEVVGSLLGGEGAPAGGSRRLQYLKYDMISMLTRALPEGDEAQRTRQLELIGSVEESQTLEQLRSGVLSAVQDACGFYRNRRDAELVSEQVSAYVREHFADEDLNVNLLGQKFDLTPSYLSRLFKAQTGEVLKDYIAHTRLEHARLLLKSERPLEQIAKMSGFLNAGTLIRTFKKHYGMTPGKYREETESV